MIQTKLEVEEPNDEFEQEADRVTELSGNGDGSILPSAAAQSRSALGNLQRLNGSQAALQIRNGSESAAVRSAPLLPSLTGILQRKCACAGGCSSCSPERDDIDVQPKLEINTPGDAWEVEADNIADLVVDARSRPPGAQPIAQDQRDAPVVALSRTAEPVAPQPGRPTEGVENGILNSQGRGAPLQPVIRDFMEHSLQSDMGSVRVHTDAAADSLSTRLHSYAFTSGNDIFFARGYYRPDTLEGNRLLAHELVHTIQQGKSRRQIQRQNWGDERHEEIQRRLRVANADLITEAPMPGSAPSKTRWDIEGRNQPDRSKMGFADLFRSEGNVIPGVRGVQGDRGFYIRNITSGDMMGRTAESRNAVTQAPRVSNKTWTGLPGFPDFEVAEIKPLVTPNQWRVPLKKDVSTDPSLAQAGYGLAQAGTLKAGLEMFAGEAYKESSKKTRAGTNGEMLDCAAQGFIPPEIDYRQFNTQLNTHANIPVYPYTEGQRRLWVYPWKPGVLLYFELGHPYRLDAVDKDRVKKLIDALTKLETRFPNKPGALPDKLPVATKRKPGSPALLVQRKTMKTADIADPSTQKSWLAWKGDFEEWNKGTKTQSGAEAFLKDKGGAFWPLAKLSIDKELHISSGLTPQEKSLEKINRWSRMGSVLGWLRFKFSWLFLKIKGLFEKLGTRLSKFKQKSVGAVKIGGGIGWEAAALAVVKKVFVELLRGFVDSAFSLVSSCVTGVIGKAFDSFVDEVKADLDEHLKGIHDQFERFHDSFVSKYEPVISFAERALSAIHKVLETLNTLAAIEKALRLLVQAISCLTPPALGCLWGLIAQVSFEVIAAKAVASDLFTNKIARPLAKKLMEKSVGDLLRGWLRDLFKGVGLESFAKEVCVLELPKPSAGEMEAATSFDPSDPEVAAIRSSVEADYGKGKMIQDLQKILKVEGKPATPEQIEDLVEIIGQSGKSPDEIKKTLTSQKGSGKKGIDVGQASGQLSRLASLPAAEVMAALGKADWKKVTPGKFIVDESRPGQPFLLSKLSTGERLGALIQIKSETIQGKRVYVIIDSSDLLFLDGSQQKGTVVVDIPFTDKTGKQSSVQNFFMEETLIAGISLLDADDLRGTTVPAR